MEAGNSPRTVLTVEDLSVEFRTRGAWHAAVRGAAFSLAENETLAIVGESGCGKTVTALAIMGLLPPGKGRIAAGKILFEGSDLARLDEREMRRLRGNRVSMIFQEPMTSLNPVMTVGRQIAESLVEHRGLSRTEAAEEAIRLMDEVRIPSGRQRHRDYPHQFSGGMRQRVMIALALACRPQILLADEPTTALDVTIQSQVLALLDELKQSYGMSMVFITHNLGVVASIADRVAVMYAGEIVETAAVDEVFARPTHPYTEALLRSIPRVDRTPEILETIAGRVPPINLMPSGCPFAPRCDLSEEICSSAHPQLTQVPAASSRHSVRCWVRGGTVASEIEARTHA